MTSHTAHTRGTIVPKCKCSNLLRLQIGLASGTTHEPQSNVAHHPRIPVSMFIHPDPLLFIPFILRPKTWHRGPRPKAHWYMCADYNHYNYSPLNLSDVPVTHNFSSTGLSFRMNCWSSSGLINCFGVIQVASSTGNPFHSTKNSLTIFLFLLNFRHRNIFSISQYGSSTLGASS